MPLTGTFVMNKNVQLRNLTVVNRHGLRYNNYIINDENDPIILLISNR